MLVGWLCPLANLFDLQDWSRSPRPMPSPYLKERARRPLPRETGRSAGKEERQNCSVQAAILYLTPFKVGQGSPRSRVVESGRPVFCAKYLESSVSIIRSLLTLELQPSSFADKGLPAPGSQFPPLPRVGLPAKWMVTGQLHWQHHASLAFPSPWQGRPS